MKKKITITVVVVATLLVSFIICRGAFIKHEAETIHDIVSKDKVFKEINSRKDITFKENIILQNKEIDNLIIELENKKHSKNIITKDLEEYIDCMIDVLEKQKELNISIKNKTNSDSASSNYETSCNKAKTIYKSITGKEM